MAFCATRPKAPQQGGVISPCLASVATLVLGLRCSWCLESALPPAATGVPSKL